MSTEFKTIGILGKSSDADIAGTLSVLYQFLKPHYQIAIDPGSAQLIVDFAGLVFAFLTITGIILFFNNRKLKQNKKPQNVKDKLKSSNRWNLKWHNKIGWITLIVLLLNTATGMFLRPPLLIAIAESKVGKIPFTELDSPNAWFDKLRAVLYDDELERYIIATNQGVYYSDDNYTYYS